MTLTTLLCLIALVLAIVDLIKSRGQSLLGWAIGCVALALTLPLLRTLVLIVSVALVAASCALTAKHPTTDQQASARKQTADTIDRLTLAVNIGTEATKTIAASSLSPALKIEIGCDILKAFGQDAPSAVVTTNCGPLPTRAASPVQRAVDTAQSLTNCASRQNTVAVALQAMEPIWRKLEAAGNTLLQVLGASLRLAMQPVTVTCGGVA